MNYFILGSLIYQRFNKKFNYLNFQESTLIALIILSFLGFLINFILPLNELVNFLFFLINIFLVIFLKKRQIKYILKKSLLFIIILIIVISFSRNPEDANLYHHSFIALINNEKISFGITNLHFRFGHISIIHYLSGLSFIPKISNYLIIIQNNFFYCLVLSIFFSFFKYGMTKKNFLLASFSFSALIYFVLKFSKYSDWGIDLIPALLSVYLCALYIKHYKTKFKVLDFNIFYLFISLIIVYIFFNRTTYIFLFFFPILFFTISNIKFNYLLNIKIIFTCSILLTIFFLKNFINSSCIIYPLYFTCFETSWSSELIEHMNYKQIYVQSKAWAMGYPNSDGSLSEELYIEKFNWINSWMKVHFIKILEKTIPFIFVIFIIYFILNILFKGSSVFKKKINLQIKSYIYSAIFFILSTIFWFLNSPLFRYGAGFIITIVILLCCMPLAKFLSINRNEVKKISKFLILCSMLILCSKNINRIIFDNSDHILPVTFKNNDMKQKKIKDQNIFYYNNFELCYYPYLSPCVKDSTSFIKNVKVLYGYKFYLTK